MTTETVAIVVHYGDVRTTFHCLDTLADQRSPLAVVVSNNGSREEAEALREHAASLWPSDTVELVVDGPGKGADFLPSVTVVHNGSNKGFAGGCNTGIRLALKHAARYVWLVNNDAAPEPGALEALLRDAARRPGTLLGATVVDRRTRDRLQLAGGAAYCPATTRMTPHHAGALLTDVPGLPEPGLDYVYGASLFAPTALFKEVGLLDESFFLFYEELDLCRRAQAAGYALGWCRDCVVAHEVSATVGRPGENSLEQARLAAFHEARSTILFTRKHHPLLLPVVLAARTAGKLAVLAARGQWELVAPSLFGLVDGVSVRLCSE